MAEEALARIRGRHRLSSTGSHEQAKAGSVLERSDLLADRGLGVSELVSGTGERACLDDSLESDEMANLDVR